MHAILIGKKLSATKKDLEAWIGFHLHKSGFSLRIINSDETGIRFQFRFYYPNLNNKGGGETSDLTWGGFELIEWSNGTSEIVDSWNTLDTNNPLITTENLMEGLKEQERWLVELFEEILATFSVDKVNTTTHVVQKIGQAGAEEGASMDRLTIFLDKTNKEQFCLWLSVYCKKKQVENRQYPYENGWNYNFYYPFDISPDFQSEIGINALFVRIIQADEKGEKITTEDWDIEKAVKVSWLEVGERMKVILEHKSGGITIYPLFEMLTEIGKDWPETQPDIWNYLQAQARKYHIELTRQPFPFDTEKARRGNVETIEPNGKTVEVLSERTKALNKLAILWVTYNQNQRISKDDDMKWFINEYTSKVGLNFLTVSEFKRHLVKAYKAGVIDKDKKTRRYIPKLAT